MKKKTLSEAKALRRGAPVAEGRLEAKADHKNKGKDAAEIRKMNWQRGLARVWTVVSILWVIFLSVMLGLYVRNIERPLIFHAGTTVLEFSNHRVSRKAVEKGLTNYFEQPHAGERVPLWDIPASDLPAGVAMAVVPPKSGAGKGPWTKYAEASARRLMGDYQPANLWRTAGGFLVLAISFPGLLLLLWFVGKWVTEGFRA